MNSLRVPSKLIGIIVLCILLLSVSYVVFMSKSLFGKLEIQEEKFFPNGIGSLSNGESPLFRQALQIQDAVNLEVSSPDKRLLVRVLHIAADPSANNPSPDPLAIYKSIRSEKVSDVIPPLVVQYLGAHLDMTRGKAQEKVRGIFCEKEFELLPLDENKSRHSLFGIVDCAGKRFYVQGVGFNKPISVEQFTEIVNLVLSKANWESQPED